MTLHKLFSETFCALCEAMVWDALAVKTFSFSTRFNTHSGKNLCVILKVSQRRKLKNNMNKKDILTFQWKESHDPEMRITLAYTHRRAMVLCPNQKRHRGAWETRGLAALLCSVHCALSLTVLTPTIPRTKARILHCYFCSCPFY